MSTILKPISVFLIGTHRKQFPYSYNLFQVDWLLADNSPLVAVSGLRRVLLNGSLEFAPFSAERYRRDVHAATYKCRVKLNSGYTILSKNIHAHAGKCLLYFIYLSWFCVMQVCVILNYVNSLAKSFLCHFFWRFYIFSNSTNR